MVAPINFGLSTFAYRSRFFVLSLLLALVTHILMPTLARADGFKLDPINNSAEIANYPLNEELLAKIEATQAEFSELPRPPVESSGNDDSVNGLAETINSQPALATILHKHQLDARTYVLAMKALQASLAAAAAFDDKDSLVDDTISVSKENLAFARTHLDRLRRLFDNWL